MNRLKELRQERKINQDVLADLLSVESSAISKLETGRVPLRDTYIVMLSKFFNVSSDYLLGITDVRNNLDPFDLKKLGFNFSKYKSPTNKQKELIKDIIEVILKDNQV